MTDLIPSEPIQPAPLTLRDDVVPGPLLPEPDDASHAPAVPPIRQTRFKLGELMETDFPEQVFVVDGLLPVGLNMLAGSHKIGKGWFFLDLGLSVASGSDFLGRSTQGGDVLYLALEDIGRRLAERIRLIAPHLKFDDLPLEIWMEAKRLDQGGLEEIENWLKSACRPQLVIIDVWGRFSPAKTGSSKNEYEQVTQDLQPLQALANQYGIAICLVHHTRKQGTDGASGGDPFDQVLGSRALTSNMDATMVLNRTRMQNDAVLTITGRDIEEQEINLTFDKSLYRWFTTERQLAPAVSPERQQVLDAVAAGHTRTGDIVAHLGKSRTAVSNLLKALCDEGALEKSSRGEYRLPDHATEADVPALPSEMNDFGDNEAWEALV